MEYIGIGIVIAVVIAACIVIYTKFKKREVISSDDLMPVPTTVISGKDELVESHQANEFVEIGDADRDGKVTITDATTIQKYLAGIIDKSMIDLTAADFDQSGDVSIIDATCIQKYLACFVDQQ